MIRIYSKKENKLFQAKYKHIATFLYSFFHVKIPSNGFWEGIDMQYTS